MNTSAVAKELGISQSTVQRWVSGANLQVERNQHGHYVFSETNIEALRQMKNQLNSNSTPQEKLPVKKARKGSIQPIQRSEEIQAIITEMDRKLDEKADSVVSYQLLQHRSDIEEMQDLIRRLENRIEKLESSQDENSKNDKILVFDGSATVKKNPKKWRIFQILFGF